MSEVKITIVNDDGVSTITGKGFPLRVSLKFPTPFFLRFNQYKTEGKVWKKGDFDLTFGKIEYNGEEYEIPEGCGEWEKTNDETGEKIDVRIHPSQQPKKIFKLIGY
ncbi:hypothetical protein ACTFIW_011706 [Dictyostelium discoideum]